MDKKIGILGAGAWGTALAVAIANEHRQVTLWTRNQDIINSISNEQVNSKYLPLIDLNENIKATNELKLLSNHDIILLVVPAQTLRSNLQLLSTINLDKSIPLVICCKGIESDTSLLMSEIVAEILPDNPICVLSGPNFAHEVANNLPTAATLACNDLEIANNVAAFISSQNFRLYTANDIIGAQIGGALKNIIAIACGISQGKRLGENARAALITRGLAEMKRFCHYKGGKDNTLMGLSGLGDLVLTCSSLQSRNMSFGYNLGEDRDLKEIMGASNKLVEGVDSAKAIYKIIKEADLNMPICYEIYQILFEDKKIDHAMHDLLNRPIVIENN